MSPTCSAEALDPLVAETAKRLAAVLDNFKRELYQRDGISANVTGRLELVLQAQTFELAIVHDEDGKESLVGIHARLKSQDATNSTSSLPVSSLQHSRSRLDATYETDSVPPKKRKHHGDIDPSEKTRRTHSEAEENRDNVLSITKKDLKHALGQLHENIQDDTSDSVYNVQRLLRSFKDEWHTQQSQRQRIKPPLQDSISSARSNPPTLSLDDHNISIAETIRREAKLTSAQIKWVEDCRRVATDLHNQREETWRTSSAGFHDRQRQHGEAVEARMLQESTSQAELLRQVLDEVKAIGQHTQSLQWEIPGSNVGYPTPSSVAMTPAFATEPGQTAQDQTVDQGETSAPLDEGR